MLCFLLTWTEWTAASYPTYKYFPLEEEYTEVDPKEAIVQECYNYGVNVTSKFLDDFQGPHPIVLIHAWKRTLEEKGDFYAVEVMRLRIRYLIIVNIPIKSEPGEKFLHSVRILNEEAAGGAHWFQPEDEMVELALGAVKEKFGDEIDLRNVAVFKTVMKVATFGQMVIDVDIEGERALLDIRLVRKFGEKATVVESITRIY
jgi:hypothetical protein